MKINTHENLYEQDKSIEFVWPYTFVAFGLVTVNYTCKLLFGAKVFEIFQCL